jgi:nitrogen fixation protein NifU and related proteins
MNSELSDLYQEVILDHNKNPRNFGKIDNPTNMAIGHNPLCGDHIDVELIVENNIIKDIKFNGSGCAISKASASIMTTLLKGQNLEDAKKHFDNFIEIVTGELDEEIDLDSMGKLAVFAGVREYPSRIKCAGLAWHTMNNAIQNKEEAVTTE